MALVEHVKDGTSNFVQHTQVPGIQPQLQPQHQSLLRQPQHVYDSDLFSLSCILLVNLFMILIAGFNFRGYSRNPKIWPCGPKLYLDFPGTNSLPQNSNHACIQTNRGVFWKIVDTITVIGSKFGLHAMRLFGS